MDKGLINYLPAKDVYYLTRHGKTWPVFTGPCPFDWDRASDDRRLYERPWVISHPEAKKDQLYKAIGIEAYAINYIHQGTDIGVLVEEIN